MLKNLCAYVQSNLKENYGHFKRKMDCLDDFDLNLGKNLEIFASSEKIGDEVIYIYIFLVQ